MFLETAEKLNTINKIVALSFNAWSFTLIFGVIFLLLLAALFIYRRQLNSALPKFNSRTMLLLLIILGWSPLFFDSLFSSWWTMWRQSALAGSAVEARTRHRLCAIDKNQNLDNSVCSLSSFMAEVRTLVPAPAKVALSSNGFFSLFLQYYLMPDYQVSDPESANYWLLYLPASNYRLDGQSNLLESQGATEKNWGRWQVIRLLGEGMVILKRQ